jgi:hypothetical protein
VPTIEELRRITKPQIEETFSEVRNEILRNGFLDHEIRAIEDLMTERFKAIEKAEAQAQDPPRSPRPTYYKIYKSPKGTLGIGQGVVYSFDYGLEIRYSPLGERLNILIAISHELGHCMLGHLEYLKKQDHANTQLIRDSVLETQASYFAKKSVEYRSAQYHDEEYITSHYFNEETIKESISRIHDGYDEDLIPN